MPKSPSQHFEQIAKRAALRDIEAARTILLRLQHDWRGLSSLIEGQTTALVNDIDGLQRSISKQGLSQ